MKVIKGTELSKV